MTGKFPGSGCTFLTEADKRSTCHEEIAIGNGNYHRYTGEFWTSRQRQANALHEIAYRACFKPQLPAFFIERLTEPGDAVYDPFSGRGTTALESVLRKRSAVANDINPISRILCEGRLVSVTPEQVEQRLQQIGLRKNLAADLDLSMFFHRDTLQEILSLRDYFMRKGEDCDDTDKWIRTVATNRLTGHSSGYFSVYTLPPNQSATAESQIKINARYSQTPPYRNTKELILKKTRTLLKNLSQAHREALRQSRVRYYTEDARRTPGIEESSLRLTVTSPPFLNVVQYEKDNWLRCWFNNIEVKNLGITAPSGIRIWEDFIGEVLAELYRITAPEGWVAFEVGEVNKGKRELENSIVPLGEKNGLRCRGILINRQNFTKTANIWGVDNNKKGTNSNRIAVFQKPG